MSDDEYLADTTRSATLADVGAPGYLAATIVDTDGSTHYTLARIDAMGDHATRFDATAAYVAHEQLEPLPLETVRRITIAARQQLTERPKP